MKKLFVAIRKGELETVRELLEKKPELVSCRYSPKDKQDDGQSPLQVAIKSGQFEIANILLDGGADVNFMESPDCCNPWRMPALHDAIRAAVMSCRWNTNDKALGLQARHTREEAGRAFALLERMFTLGGDIHGRDSYENSCLCRAVLDAQQILPSYRWQTGETLDDRLLTPELEADLSRIFSLLFAQGADLDYVRPGFDQTIRERCAVGPIAQFIK